MIAVYFLVTTNCSVGKLSRKLLFSEIKMFAVKCGSTIRSLVDRSFSEQLKFRSLLIRNASLLAVAGTQDQEFSVGVDNGFLPRQEPLAKLPDEFGALESLLQRMPMQLPDGTPGLLASGQFGDAIRDELPIYNVDSITDQRLLSGKKIPKTFLYCVVTHSYIRFIP